MQIIRGSAQHFNQPTHEKDRPDHGTNIGTLVQWYQNLSADNKNAIKNILGAIGGGIYKVGEKLMPDDLVDPEPARKHASDEETDERDGIGYEGPAGIHGDDPELPADVDEYKAVQQALASYGRQ